VGRRELPSLGARGEGWVALQALLLLGVVVAGRLGPRWPEGSAPWRLGIAALTAVAAIPLMAGGFRGLGAQLTPFPKPVEGGELRQHGVYGLVRHPIYGGVLLLCVAGALVASPLAFLPTVLLALLFEGKRRREEAWLVERYPGYEDYRRRVRRSFIPFVW
jgi:protein-S-isoprenylcysteine O-methyltransferase Ste14